MNRRLILTRLLQIQALIGVIVLLWLFLGGDTVEQQAANTQLSIDISDLAQDTLKTIDRGNYQLVLLRPSDDVLQQLATTPRITKITRSEPPQRDYRESVTVKVFVLARFDDHYLIASTDHWQRDIACDALVYDAANHHATRLVCQRREGDIVFDAAGRSLDAGIADLEMPQYDQTGDRLRLTLPH